MLFLQLDCDVSFLCAFTWIFTSSLSNGVCQCLTALDLPAEATPPIPTMHLCQARAAVTVKLSNSDSGPCQSNSEMCVVVPSFVELSLKQAHLTNMKYANNKSDMQ